MPACLTHYYFAQNVRENLPDASSLDACAYAWGAQGPDFFFCHRFLPFWRGRSLQEYGGRLHDEMPSKVLGAMREFLKAHPDPVYRSYVWGFVCHYSLDCTAHPYINWLAQELVRQRPWETPSTMHGEVEAALDAIVLRYETGKLPSEVPLKTMFPKNHGVEGKIARLYRQVLFTLYGEDVPEGAAPPGHGRRPHYLWPCHRQNRPEEKAGGPPGKGPPLRDFQPHGAPHRGRPGGLRQRAERPLGGWELQPKLLRTLRRGPGRGGEDTLRLFPGGPLRPYRGEALWLKQKRTRKRAIPQKGMALTFSAV